MERGEEKSKLNSDLGEEEGEGEGEGEGEREEKEVFGEEEGEGEGKEEEEEEEETDKGGKVHSGQSECFSAQSEGGGKAQFPLPHKQNPPVNR